MADNALWRSVQGEIRRSSPPALRRQVLVAIEDAAIRTLILEVLWLDGHDVSAVRDEDDLLTALWSIQNDLDSAPEVVVLDGRLAGPHGIEGLARLRDRSPRPAIIVLSAPENYAIQAEAIRLDAMVLVKPIDLDDLRTAVLHLPTTRAPRPAQPGKVQQEGAAE